MAGRDPHEPHRVATPLELLFDLTFATSFATAAAQMAHMLAAGHIVPGLIGFAIAAFAICWAWTNFTWFASAFDTDDWLFRVATMVQMAGVLVLAVGLPRMFASIEHGAHLDPGVMVAGYVVMRVAMVSQWLRAARQNPDLRTACLSYAGLILLVQVGWIGLVLADLPLVTALLAFGALALLECAAPIIGEHIGGGTPWHPHHVAERYSLFAIIAMGEGVVGTVAALSAAIDETGWTVDAALVCIAGLGLTFGMWWVYFMLPSAQVIHAHRDRAFPWSFTQVVIIAAIVATGAGLHVGAYFIEHEAKISAFTALLATVVPVAVFLCAVYGLYAYLVQRFDGLHMLLLAGTAAVIAAALAAAARGVPIAHCLIILMLAPVVTIVGYEWFGHRHLAEALAEET
ncbi:MAG TPA: low temperature requirement protein A [Sphingomonas sp.]|nr:low temperature requirement protein A [Sphingomonas sp.]